MSMLYRPEGQTHTCAPPVDDWMMRPPPGPSALAPLPSLDERDDLARRGCRHYLDGSDRQPWAEGCPVHPVPEAAKVGVKAAEPVGSVWRCDDCGTVWIVRTDREVRERERPWQAPRRGGYSAGGPPQWSRATWWERLRWRGVP